MPYAHGGLGPMPMSTSYESSKGYTYSIKLIPILATLFVFGRIAFWIGYLKQPIERAFGLGVTLYPPIAVLIYDAYRVLFFNS